jgi:hypothetical protein
MKQNMCVTIDEEIHSWLRSKPKMMSRLVNGILWAAMQKEMQNRAIESGEQTTLELYHCPKCKRYPQGDEICECGNTELELIE